LQCPKVPKALPKPLFRMIGQFGQLQSYFTGKPPDVTPELAAIFCGTQVIHSQKAIRELSYEPQPVREMFEECWEWLKQEKLLESQPSP
jgi:dihydroflavonol-4-reductase